jgi:beta-glucosidase
VILQFQANAATLPHLKDGEFPSSFFNGFSLKTPDTSFRNVSFRTGNLLAASYLDRREGQREGRLLIPCLTNAAGNNRMRLLGFERVELAPGESKPVTVKADPRLLAGFDGTNGLGQWRIKAGTYRVAVGKSAGDLVLAAEAPLMARVFGK